MGFQLAGASIPHSASTATVDGVNLDFMPHPYYAPPLQSVCIIMTVSTAAEIAIAIFAQSKAHVSHSFGSNRAKQ